MSIHTEPATGRPVTERAAGHYLTRDHTVTGTATQLANLVANHHNAGTLVAMTAPRPVGDRFQILIRVREPRPSRPTARVSYVGEPAYTRIRRPRRGARLAVIITAITGIVAGLVAIAAYLLGQLVELIAANAGQILGVLALVAILAGLCACRSGRRHCPGC
jgi:hypothetical protein